VQILSTGPSTCVGSRRNVSLGRGLSLRTTYAFSRSGIPYACRLIRVRVLNRGRSPFKEKVATIARQKKAKAWFAITRQRLLVRSDQDRKLNLQHAPYLEQLRLLVPPEHGFRSRATTGERLSPHRPVNLQEIGAHHWTT
jgi:hypothetical protein